MWKTFRKQENYILETRLVLFHNNLQHIKKENETLALR